MVGILDEANIMSTTCDLVSFRWLERTAPGTPHIPNHGGDLLRKRDVMREDTGVSYQNMVPSIGLAQQTHYTYSNPTLWIGVKPDTLTALGARDVARKIRTLLDGLEVGRVDIAFRERDAQLSAKPLSAPVHNGHDLEPVIHQSSAALSLYIADLDGHMAGTCGPYFRAGGKLYAMTARHVLFTWNESQTEYRCHGSCFNHIGLRVTDPIRIRFCSKERCYINGPRNIHHVHHIYQELHRNS